MYAHLTATYKSDKLMLLLAVLILAPVIAYDGLRKTTNPGKTYLAFCIASSAFVLPIIVITTIRNDFQFQPDSVWLGLIPVVGLCIWLLLKSNDRERKPIFLVTAISLIVVFVAMMFFHPYMYMRVFRMSFLPISVRLNGVYFIYLLMFVLAGFYRLGLLPDRFNHTKLMVPVIILAILSYGTRLPAVSRFFAASPLTEPVPLVLGSLLILLVPGITLSLMLNAWLRHRRASSN